VPLRQRVGTTLLKNSRVATRPPFFMDPLSHLLLDALRNVDLAPQAVDAHVGRVAGDGDAAQAAQPARESRSSFHNAV